MSNGHRYCCLAMLESTTKLKIHRTVFLVSRGIVICSKSHPPRLLLSVRMHNSTVQRASQPFFLHSICQVYAHVSLRQTARFIVIFAGKQQRSMEYGPQLACKLGRRGTLVARFW